MPGYEPARHFSRQARAQALGQCRLECRISLTFEACCNWSYNQNLQSTTVFNLDLIRDGELIHVNPGQYTYQDAAIARLPIQIG